MEDTYNIKAIILKREPFRENDTRVVVYSGERGKLELVARGTKKIKSKMAGHLEPIILANLMVVRGRIFDYIGSAVSENCYPEIKGDLRKIKAASRIVSITGKLIKEGEGDSRIFSLLEETLDIINKNEPRFADCDLLPAFFVLRLLTLLGYKPELYQCVSCQKKIAPADNRFSFIKGGIVCSNCSSKEDLTFSDNCVKVLRMAVLGDLRKIIRLEIKDNLAKEVKKTIGSFLKFNHNP